MAAATIERLRVGEGARHIVDEDALRSLGDRRIRFQELRTRPADASSSANAMRARNPARATEAAFIRLRRAPAGPRASTGSAAGVEVGLLSPTATSELLPPRLRLDPAAAFRRCLPILRRTVVVAGIFRVSPVRRLRPRRALAHRLRTGRSPPGSPSHPCRRCPRFGQHAAHDGLDDGLRLPGVACHAFDQICEKHDALP